MLNTLPESDYDNKRKINTVLSLVFVNFEVTNLYRFIMIINVLCIRAYFFPK